MDGDQYVGVIICKLDRHKDRLRGYIAMLAVAKTHRKKSIGSNLVKMAIRAMKEMNADEASPVCIHIGKLLTCILRWC
jgi:peptide alpha-N-acetyltransferase